MAPRVLLNDAGTRRATGTTQSDLQSRRVLRPRIKPIPVAPPKQNEDAAAHQPHDNSTTQDPPKPKRRRRRAGADPWLVRRRKPTGPPKPRRPPPTHFTCHICAEDRPVDEFIEWVNNSKYWRIRGTEVPISCIAHLSRSPRRKNDPVCRECIGKSLAAQMDTVGARNVGNGCLEPGCNTRWDFDVVMSFFPLDRLEEYNVKMLPVWQESVKMMACTKDGCDAVGLVDMGAPGYPQVSCFRCETRMCASCEVEWHTDMTCGEYNARHIHHRMTAPEMDTLEIMQKKDGKRCPNCYIVIEKDGGCNGMYCMGCKTFFDWETAPSAVPGKGPPPQQAHNPFNMRHVVCEMDGLKAKQAKRNAIQQDPKS
ncbi:hypothetical protein EJ04DRAFT_482172 [Polyplosphaeria fusca]|uniref:RBR-type E3 ubiquitin transferase n=1 Tax=Polyplosphaeria fusca TaxID=682080 RepID=A0A9P4RBA9_9PLEO|nr:hypothetical protein EJ04DRAFT_482172 [Polyplosphaeria fusca]